MTKVNNLLKYLPTYWVKDTTSNNYNFFNSFDPDMQNVSDQVEELKKDIQLSTAEGSQLDGIGRLFLLFRLNNESDTDYRARIKAYWPGYSGGGTIESIKQTINRMTGVAKDDITITEYHSGSYIQPLKFMVTVNIPTLGVNATTVSNVIQNTKAAGTYVLPNISTSLSDLYVNTFSDSNVTINDNDYFYGDFALPDLNILM